MGKLFTQYWFTKNTPAHINVSVYILLSFDKQIISTRQPSVHLFIYHAEIKKMKIIFLQKIRLSLSKSMSDLITCPVYLLGHHIFIKNRASNFEFKGVKFVVLCYLYFESCPIRKSINHILTYLKQSTNLNL